MAAVWTLALKDLRLLFRDVRSVIILLAMPVIFIIILGLLVGEGFGQKPAEQLRVSILDLDVGDKPVVAREAVAMLAAASPAPAPGADLQLMAALALSDANRQVRPPEKKWSKIVSGVLPQP